MSTPRVGPPPLASVVLVELGATAALVAAGIDRALLPLGGMLLAAALLVGLLRWRGRWVLDWLGVAARYRCRVREREAEPGDPGDGPGDDAARGRTAEDRLALIRLVAGDVVVSTHRDHDGRSVGLLGQQGVWSAVLAPADTDTPLVTGPDDDAALPLAELAAQLRDRGVVLDALTVLWHRPRGAGVDDAAPAVTAYRELLGPLTSGTGRGSRRGWLVMRLDPARCPTAVTGRGGGAVGAQRALLGATARIRRVLADHGVAVRPLDPDEVLDAAVAPGMAGLGQAPTTTERWDAVVTAGDDAEAGHATFALRVPDAASGSDPLAGLWSVDAAATTVALTLEPVDDTPDGTIGLRCAVRLTAPSPSELAAAGADLAVAAGSGALRRLDGCHAAGLVATLPVPDRPVARTRRGVALGPALVPTDEVRPDQLVPWGPPLGTAGIVLGADADGAPVSISLLRPEPTRVVVLGGLSLARELALRVVGSGSRVSVVTGRPTAWENLRRAGSADRLVVRRERPAPGEGSPTEGAAPEDDAEVIVHDRGLAPRGPDTAPGRWRTTVLVLPALTPAVTDLADDADLVLITRMPPHEAELAGRLWRLRPEMTEELRTLPDHAVIALGPQLWRRVERVTAPRETAILGPVRLGD